MSKQKKILFFADRLPPTAGGMEVHGGEFIRYFKNHPLYPIEHVVTKEIEPLSFSLNPKILFFNSGRWIETFTALRSRFPHALFIYRTGGNEIIKAPLVHHFSSCYEKRKKYWVEMINRNIDLLITNSTFTEKRLRELGITIRFAKCVGGVSCIQPRKKNLQQAPILFSAARFVPYKNPLLLIQAFKKIYQKNHEPFLRIAGDGPLLQQAKQEAKGVRNIQFLGEIDNQEVIQEMAQADLYLQLSSDYEAKIPGGSYIHTEGMGRSILEAISSGTYVIAGKCGALSEIVTERRGKLISLENTEDLVREIEKIVAKLPMQLIPTSEYSWNNLFKCYEDLYESVNNH